MLARALLCFVSAVLLGGCAAAPVPPTSPRGARPDDATPREVNAVQPPPEPRPEDPGTPTSASAVWARGHWDWTGRDWEWRPGYWQPARADQVWIDGRWERRARGWVWIEGRWAPRTP